MQLKRSRFISYLARKILFPYNDGTNKNRKVDTQEDSHKMPEVDGNKFPHSILGLSYLSYFKNCIINVDMCMAYSKK